MFMICMRFRLQLILGGADHCTLHPASDEILETQRKPLAGGFVSCNAMTAVLAAAVVEEAVAVFVPVAAASAVGLRVKKNPQPPGGVVPPGANPTL